MKYSDESTRKVLTMVAHEKRSSATMTTTNSAGYFRSGLPYNRFGTGSRTLVAFQGLWFENKPVPVRLAPSFSGYAFLETDYTIYLVTRKPGLPAGYSLSAIAADYADMVNEEFGQPVDVIGLSTGGSIAQHFAADHPHLVRRLVLHSAAHTLGAVGREFQLHLAILAQQRRWRKAIAEMISFVLPRTGIAGAMNHAVAEFAASLLVLFPGMKPADPSDLVITIEAEDKHNFLERLSEITAPTLVVAGENDPFYSPALFQATAAGMPNARLILYPNMGHPASGSQFRHDLRTFLLS